MRTPPSAGPTAAPNVPAIVQTATPRAVEPVSAPSTGSEPASSSAPPRPWTDRAAIEHRERVRERAGDRRPEEHHRSCREQQRCGSRPVHDEDEREGADGEYEVVGRDHPRDALDRGVEARVELGEREDDDRGVGEGDGDGDRDRHEEQRLRALAPRSARPVVTVSSSPPMTVSRCEPSSLPSRVAPGPEEAIRSELRPLATCTWISPGSG